MGITLVLKLVSGDLNQGFTVLLQVRHDPDGLCLLEQVGHLPADHQLEELYQNWQTSFRNLIYQGRNSLDKEWGFPDDFTTNISSSSDFEACRNYVSLLEDNMERWLCSSSDKGWQQVQQQITFQLGKHSGEVRLVIQSDSKLWKLPWLSWNVFRLKSAPSKDEIGIGFSPVEYQKLEALNRGERQGSSVRILAVFGSGENLNLEPDRMAINQLPNAKIHTLNEPSGTELIQKLRDKQGWDIFCFSGHSETRGRDGIIYINDRESLEIRQFQEALKIAICQGLKIAIFNSCDGLGLAFKLAGLQLPVAIVMKEPVPDLVAQCFLKVFLSEYASGAPLYTAVRRSQNQLEDFLEFPGCSSLPIICQNPAEVPPTWAELSQRQPIVVPPPVPPGLSPVPRKKPQTRRWQKLGRTLAASFAIALFVLSAQWHGKLQTLELYAYDHLMRQLPLEELDTRLLIVGADETDLQKYGEILPDVILAELLQKITSYNPAVIGLNIIRDRPVENADYPGGHDSLKAILSNSKSIVPVCYIGPDFDQSTAPFPGLLKPDQKVGFLDVNEEEHLISPNFLRRYLLSRTSNPGPNNTKCQTNYSLGWHLVYRYLQHQDPPIPVTTVDKNWKFGPVLHQRISNRSGGYQNFGEVAEGNQLLIRYRHRKNPNKIAHQMTVRDFIEENPSLDPARIKDKVVIIGVTAPTLLQKEPSFYTPYGKVTGLNVHAHVVSQLLSAVEGELKGKNQRPLIWWWPQWANMLWILGWSLLGGFLIWLFPQPLHHWIAISSTSVVFFVICWIVLIQSGWIPLVPPLLTLIIPTGWLSLYTIFKLKSFE